MDFMIYWLFCNFFCKSDVIRNLEKVFTCHRILLSTEAMQLCRYHKPSVKQEFSYTTETSDKQYASPDLNAFSEDSTSETIELKSL